MSKKETAAQSWFSTLERLDLRAHQTKDLKYFLKKYFRFRAYVQFSNGKKVHLYGNEHAVTYNQLLFSKLSDVKLDRFKGFNDLVDLIERKYRGQYRHAKIYMREGDATTFDKLIRQYDNTSELIYEEDPVLDANDDVLTLHYYIHQGKVMIQEENPANEDFTIPE